MKLLIMKYNLDTLNQKIDFHNMENTTIIEERRGKFILGLSDIIQKYVDDFNKQNKNSKFFFVPETQCIVDESNGEIFLSYHYEIKI